MQELRYVQSVKPPPDIAYLSPEFPGQTHSFIWRELEVLRAHGLHVRLLSTKRPPAGIRSHAWTGEAMNSTAFLNRPSARDALGAAGVALRAGPRRWVRALRTLRSGVAESRASHKDSVSKLWATLPMGLMLAARARREGWRHLHVHSAAKAAMVAAVASMLSPVTYSVILHGFLHTYGPHQGIKFGNALFGMVITDAILQDLRRAIGDVEADLVVAPMGVDLERFTRATEYPTWSPDQPLRLFSCGRFIHGKGHGDLIGACLQMLDDGVPLQLTIAGEDAAEGAGYRREQQVRVDATPHAAAFRFLGAVNEDAICKELDAAHAFVLMSHEEGLGVSIMEAMAYEVPVVASDAGGIRELITHDVEGLLATPQDPAAIRAALERVMAESGEGGAIDRWRQAAREKVERDYTSARSAGVLMDALVRHGVLDASRIGRPEVTAAESRRALPPAAEDA